MQTVKFKSFDETELACYLWDDVENPKALVMLAHGMGEHALRYTHFAEFLNKNGYLVFADDHRGHGATETDENRGHHDGDMFSDTVKDLVYIQKYLRDKYNLPILFLGHSYGSFLGQSFLEQNTDVVGVALTGSNYMSNFSSRAGVIAATPLYLIKKSMRMGILDKVSGILYDGKYKEDKKETKLWLTRDAEFRQISRDDPMTSVPMSVAFCRSLLANMIKVNKLSNCQKIKVTTPIGLFSGSMDPIGAYGKGVAKLKRHYENLGVLHLEYHLYEGARHEVLNETNRQTVFSDILAFFNVCVERATAKQEDAA